MEPEVSPPHSKVLAACPYPQTAYLVHPLTSHLLKINPNWFFQVVSFPQVSQQNSVYASPPYVLNPPPISFFSISSTEQYWVRSTDH